MRNRFSLSHLRRRWGRARSDSLTIFNFHGMLAAPLDVPDLSFMTREAFLRHLDVIRRGYEVLPVREGIDRVVAGKIERPAAAITFDDGLASFHDLVFPILQEARLPASCFLATALIGTEDALWYARVHLAVSETARGSFSWRGRSYDLSSKEARARVSIALQEALKKLRPPEQRAALNEIADLLGVARESAVPPGSPFRMLGEAEIRRMAGSGLVEFGAHTRRHPILSLLSPEEEREEIVGSVEDVRRLTGQAADLFAYPNGRRRDYGAASMAALREAGVRAALTTRRGRCTRRSRLLELPRFWVGEATPLEDLAP